MIEHRLREVGERKMAMLSTSHISYQTAVKLCHWADYAVYDPVDPMHAPIQDGGGTGEDGAAFMSSINAVPFGWQISLDWVMYGDDNAQKFVPADLFLLCVACKMAGFDWLWLDRDAPEYDMFPMHDWEEEELGCA